MVIIILFLLSFEILKLKTCSLYHEKLLLQKFNDMITQDFAYLFSASDIMEAVRGRFCFYTTYERLRNSRVILLRSMH